MARRGEDFAASLRKEKKENVLQKKRMKLLQDESNQSLATLSKIEEILKQINPNFINAAISIVKLRKFLWKIGRSNKIVLRSFRGPN